MYTGMLPVTILGREGEMYVLTEIVYDPCSFCGSKTIGNTYEGGNNIRWSMCLRSDCWQAAFAQKERIYAGLVDCEETRQHALNWINRDQKKK